MVGLQNYARLQNPWWACRTMQGTYSGPAYCITVQGCRSLKGSKIHGGSAETCKVAEPMVGLQNHTRLQNLWWACRTKQGFRNYCGPAEPSKVSEPTVGLQNHARLQSLWWACITMQGCRTYSGPAESCKIAEPTVGLQNHARLQNVSLNNLCVL